MKLQAKLALVTHPLVLACVLTSPVQAQEAIEAWGFLGSDLYTSHPTEPEFTQVSAGAVHSLALRMDGSIAAWGLDEYGQIADIPAGSGFSQVVAGHNHSMALRADGSIASWGDDSSGQVTLTPGGTGFTQLAEGLFHCLALRADGSIAAWGLDSDGQISGTPTGTGFTQVASGLVHSMALRVDGSIVSWGNNTADQVADTPAGTSHTQIDAAWFHSLALRSDGSIAAWGITAPTPPSLAGFVQVATGRYHSLALRADGSIASWGADLYGLVSDTPGGTRFTQISGGGDHSLALRATAGTVYCASATPNSSGSLGAALLLGSESVADNNFSLYGYNMPGGVFGFWLMAQTQANVVGFGGGEGTLCLGMPTIHLNADPHDPFKTAPDGTTRLDIDLTYLPQVGSVQAGETWNFQAWHRDFNNGSSTSNTSAALWFTFEP